MDWLNEFVVLKEVITFVIVGFVMMMGVMTLINFLINKDANENIENRGENE